MNQKQPTISQIDVMERELERLKSALQLPQPPGRFAQIYAAQQALAWAINPEGYGSPMDVIERGAVPSSARDIPAD